MVSNSGECRLEKTENRKVKMENGARLGPEAAERRISKWKMGVEARAGVLFCTGCAFFGGKCTGVNVVRPVPRVAVRMMRPQWG
jgi:hypothetical protein